MTTIASRELRNDTAGLLRRVAAGERLRISVNGQPMADLVPIARQRRPTIPRAELIQLLASTQADAGLRDDLAELAGDTTDDLREP